MTSRHGSRRDARITASWSPRDINVRRLVAGTPNMSGAPAQTNDGPRFPVSCNPLTQRRSGKSRRWDRVAQRVTVKKDPRIHLECGR